MNTPVIEEYRFGLIRIDGEVYTRDVIILPDRIINNWRRRNGHSLHPDDLIEIFKSPPELLVVGTGSSGRMAVPNETLEELNSEGIEVITHQTGQAWKIYNQSRLDRRTAAALHLTC